MKEIKETKAITNQTENGRVQLSEEKLDTVVGGNGFIGGIGGDAFIGGISGYDSSSIVSGSNAGNIRGNADMGGLVDPNAQAPSGDGTNYGGVCGSNSGVVVPGVSETYGDIPSTGIRK